MRADLVSTIIPVFNRASLLCQAVASVLAQSYRPIEVIIVDDGSTDETPAAAGRLAQAHPGLVRVVRIANGGPGLAREAGRLLAEGEFIQHLDSDDVLLPSKFAVQVRALRDQPDCGVAFGITRLIDEGGAELQCPYKGTGQARDFLFPGLLTDRWWSTHTPLYRRTVCEQVGAWTDMRMGEDWEYDARVGALGTRLAFCSEVVSCHRDHQHGRLTRGPLTAQILRDQSRLLPSLLNCAQQAAVRPDCAEMEHFSRWAFLVARQAAAIGLVEAAEVCYRVSISASVRKRVPLVVAGLLARTVGWHLTGRICALAEALRRRKR